MSESYKPEGTFYGISTKPSDGTLQSVSYRSGASNVQSGSFLKNPDYVGDGNFSTNIPGSQQSNQISPEYFTQMEKILNDTTGKYIGSVPKIGQTSTGKTMALGDMNQPAKVETPSAGKQTLQTAQNTIGALADTKKNLTYNEQQDDLRVWQEKGKYWFDPNLDLKPDIDKYVAQMPRELDSIEQGSLVAPLSGKPGTAQNVFVSGLNPAAFKTDNEVISNVINPLNLFDYLAGDGFANYVGARAAEGGLSGGPAGALIGVVEGLFSWFSAKDADEKRERQTRADAEEALKQWSVNRNKRLAAQRKELYDQRKAERDTQDAKEEKKSNKSEASVANRRLSMINAFESAGGISAANRTARVARWK